MATFMAKWSMDWPGQSGHIHMSLRDAAGKPVFHQADAPHGMSDVMRWFVGGQQKLMPELLAMISPTVNSYTRLIPGFWAPTDSAWSVDNRTTALRVISGSPKSQRVEFRVAAADANPYISLAAARAGFGIARVPDFVVENNLKNGELVRLLDKYEPESPVTMYIVYPHARHLASKVRVFVDFLIERYSRTKTKSA